MKYFLVPALLIVPALAAQVPATVSRERAEFAQWLSTANNSPLVARGVAPIGPGIRIGSGEAEIVFPGIEATLVERGGSVRLAMDGGNERIIPRDRVTSVGPMTLFVAGPAGRGVAVVYGGERQVQTPEYYAYDGTKIFVGALQPIAPRRFPTLTLDGMEVEATEVGSVVVPDGSGTIRLKVYRIPEPGGEESELMIYFRDATSGKGSYPAGRFVALEPVAEGRYRLDFNRARNPFCAYRSVFPCPAPWPGNTLNSAVEAGEKYHSSTPANTP
jgi:hypothetical protein